MMILSELFYLNYTQNNIEGSPEKNIEVGMGARVHSENVVEEGCWLAKAT